MPVDFGHGTCCCGFVPNNLKIYGIKNIGTELRHMHKLNKSNKSEKKNKERDRNQKSQADCVHNINTVDLAGFGCYLCKV